MLGTDPELDLLTAALFGKNRMAVLGLLYGHADERFYLREIVRAAGGGVGAVQRELRQLTRAGVLRRHVEGRHVYFQANAECPVFAELRGLVTKTAGTVEILRTALAPLRHSVQVAFIFGSVARGEERRVSDVDLLVVGTVRFADLVAAVLPAQERLRREINPTVYPPEEFRSKLGSRHPFLQRVVADPKLFLLGDQHELAKLAGQPLAHTPADQPTRNRRPVGRRRTRSGRLPDSRA
jgi:predicted nucleotidyltransferase